MLTPSYLLHATEPAEEIAEKLHQDILEKIIERIMIRFRRGDKYILTAVDKWQLETLQEAGYLLDDIQKLIAKETPYMQSEIAEAMEDAGVKALEYDDKIYRDAGLDPVPLVQSPNLINIMQRDFEATLGDWVNFTRTTVGAAEQAFIRACDNAYHQAMTGAISPAQAVREALDNLISNGVYVEYDTGHRDTIETATARAVRTGISQATAHIQLARMDEMDADLVLVSSHLGARPSHAEWQGKVYSRTGRDYPDFKTSTRYGEVDGLCGANCRHNFGPWFEGMGNPFEQYDSEENKKQYELEQRQRTLERRIRDTKQETMNWKTAMDSATDDAQRAEIEKRYQRKAALLQRQNAAYNDFCEENGLKKRSERIHIAKWDRSQAAQARAAAKRYAVDHPDSVVPKEYKPRPKKKPEVQKPQKHIEYQNPTQEDYSNLGKVSRKNVSKEDQNQIFKHDGGGYVATHNYSTINSNLRKDGYTGNPLTDDDKKTISALDRAISQTQTDKDYVFTRYVNADYLTNNFGVYQIDFHGEQETISNMILDFRNTRKQVPRITQELQNLVGTDDVDPAFLSTSMIPDKNIMKSKSVLIKIKVPKGTNVYVPKNRKESECIFGRGIKRGIESVEFDEQQNKWIITEVVKDG